MMTTQSSRTLVLFKKLAVIPLFAGFVFLFAERVEAQENIEVIEEVPSKNDLLETDLYKEYVYSDGFIRVEDENGKKINKKYSELTIEEKKKVPPPPPLKLKIKTPSKQLINDLKDPKKFAVWIDRKVVKNTILDTYKNTDFSNYSVSFVNNNARSKRFPQEYQVHLSTNKYFKGENKKRVTNFSKYLKKEYKIEEIKETPKKKDDLYFSIPKSNASKQSITSTKVATKTKNLRLKSQNESQIFNSTGFLLIKGKKHFYVKKQNTIFYYNKQGKLVNLNGKIIANNQTNASDVIKGQYITKVYDDGLLVAEFKDNIPSNHTNDSEYDLREVTESSSPPPISPLNFVEKQKDKNVDYFYNTQKIDYDKALQLLKKNRPINIETKRVNEKLIIRLTKVIEEIKEQRNNTSTSNLESYRVLNDLYEGKRKQTPHFIKSNEERQASLMELFSKVRVAYEALTKEDKRKTKKPVHPHDPYVRLMKNNIVFYKLRTELTEEDKLLFPPPPARWDASKEEKLRVKKAREDWQKRTGNDIPVPPQPKKNKKSEWKIGNKVHLIDTKEATKDDSKSFNLLSALRENTILNHKTKNYFINNKKISETTLGTINKEKIETISTSEINEEEVNIFITTKK